MNAERPIEISPHDVKELLEDGEIFLLDCRQPEEFALAAIRDATLIPLPELPERVGELESHRSDRIVVYCHHGVRSYQVTMWLREQGFTESQSMTGGIDAWSSCIDPKVPRYG